MRVIRALAVLALATTPPAGKKPGGGGHQGDGVIACC